MNNKKTAEITLVGAGPGSVDLITIRGLRALKRADVILYDALISRDLLKLAKKKHRKYT